MSAQMIKLNYINKSNDTNDTPILIYQKNVASTNSPPIAWTVIEHCGRGANHPFVFPVNFQVAAKDSYGNYTPRQDSYPGQAFEMVLDNSGDVLRLASTSPKNPSEVEIRNNLAQGSIDACIYKDGKLLAKQSDLAPGQKADFEFQPKIYCGVVAQVQEGEELSSAITMEASTEINLFGISSADLVLYGGGAGKNAEPFEFRLENIN